MTPALPNSAARVASRSPFFVGNVSFSAGFHCNLCFSTAKHSGDARYFEHATRPEAGNSKSTSSYCTQHSSANDFADCEASLAFPSAMALRLAFSS